MLKNEGHYYDLFVKKMNSQDKIISIYLGLECHF